MRGRALRLRRAGAARAGSGGNVDTAGLGRKSGKELGVALASVGALGAEAVFVGLGGGSSLSSMRDGGLSGFIGREEISSVRRGATKLKEPMPRRPSQTTRVPKGSQGESSFVSAGVMVCRSGVVDKARGDFDGGR
jgi:hypothetical protein